MISVDGSQSLETFLVTTSGERVPLASDEEKPGRLPYILQEGTTHASNANCLEIENLCFLKLLM